MLKDFAAAETMDAVDEALSSAEDAAGSLVTSMNEKLDTIIEVHELSNADGTVSAGQKLANDLRKAVEKDINKAAGQAVSGADRRKAELQ